MFVLCTKHKLCHACVYSGCWSSLSLAALKILKHVIDWCSVSHTYQAAGTVIQWKASFLYGLNILYCRILCPSAHVVKEKAKIYSKKIPLRMLNSWVFSFCEGGPGCVTATCSAYAACTNRPMPNRKFLVWNSIAVIQGSLQTAWSDPKSRWAQGISHVNLDLPIWPSLGDIHCSVKDEPISHKDLFLVNTISVSAITSRQAFVRMNCKLPPAANENVFNWCAAFSFKDCVFPKWIQGALSTAACLPTTAVAAVGVNG